MKAYKGMIEIIYGWRNNDGYQIMDIMNKKIIESILKNTFIQCKRASIEKLITQKSQ